MGNSEDALEICSLTLLHPLFSRTLKLYQIISIIIIKINKVVSNNINNKINKVVSNNSNNNILFVLATLLL